MDSEIKLVVGAMVALGIATAALVVLPYVQVSDLKAPPQLKPYTDAQARGRAVYVSEGCFYCHSQQPRDRKAGPDFARGWGRPSVPADYTYDRPHLLGSMRTGPDLFNIGARQPSKDWHLGHLYQPRAYTPGSNMPAYPYLFRAKAVVDEGEQALALPPGIAPVGKVVVASPDALDLVKYLQSMDHTYPVLPATATAAPKP
jgi:cytochrome c oxidase cbb3-type subunit II